MDLSEIREYCLSKAGVTEDIKWEHHLCFSVGGKMFLITSPDDVPVSASVKVNDEDFPRLCSRAGFRPAPHLGRYHWIFVDDISRFSTKEWKRVIDEAFRLIAAKLSGAEKKRLGIPA